MNVALLFTSFRQFRELDYWPRLFENLPRLKASVPILFHCNNGAIDESALRQKLGKIPCAHLELIYAPQKNAGGYPYGQFEAICDVWDKLKVYDWVIHLHPDVFILDEDKLLAAVEKAEKNGAGILLTPTFGHKHPSFATDFFAFRPCRVPRSVFESYRDFDNTSIVVPLENMFFTEVHRAHLRYEVVNRFVHGHYHRDIDCLGLWHEHELSRLDLYARQPSLRWRPTWIRCLRRPYMTTRIFLTWCDRALRGIPQDSLACQLTVL